MNERNAYLQDLNVRSAPPAEELFLEDPDKPNVGDLIVPGSMVSTSYGTGPYLVDQVRRWPYYVNWHAWSISGFDRDHDTGEFRKSEQNRVWINEVVVDWTSGEPVFRHLFVCNEDRVTLEGQGFAVNRRGQGVLL